MNIVNDIKVFNVEEVYDLRDEIKSMLFGVIEKLTSFPDYTGINEDFVVTVQGVEFKWIMRTSGLVSLKGQNDILDEDSTVSTSVVFVGNRPYTISAQKSDYTHGVKLEKKDPIIDKLTDSFLSVMVTNLARVYYTSSNLRDKIHDLVNRNKPDEISKLIQPYIRYSYDEKGYHVSMMHTNGKLLYKEEHYNSLNNDYTLDGNKTISLRYLDNIITLALASDMIDGYKVIGPLI